MYYDINVSKNGVHFFATAKRSATTEDAARILYREITNAFSGSEYEITVTKCEERGLIVTDDFESLLNAEELQEWSDQRDYTAAWRC